MQVFEFHFNPKAKTDVIFESFCYEPENIYEKRMGSLYMLGFLKNTLPQNARFLDNLARTIKEKYYKSVSTSPEKALRESLKRANEYLEKIAKGGDVSWLGNLSFTVISLKNSELNFTKVGDVKIFLLRQGQIIDIDNKLKFDEIEPYPLKIFGNIVSGKLALGDTIVVLTKDPASLFSTEGLLTGIANLLPFDQKKLREILNSKKDQLLKISGSCLVINLSQEILAKEKETINQPKKLFQFPKIKLPTLKLPSFKPPKVKINVKFPLPKISLKIPRLQLPQIKVKSFSLGKNTILLLTLIFFLALGYFIFEKTEEKQLENYQNQLNQIQEKVNQAESYLILAEENPQAQETANTLLKESWQGISPLFNIASSFPSDFANQVLALKETISENLYQLNNLAEVPEPEVVFEFEIKGFIPHKIITGGNNLYFYSPYAENIFKLSKNGENEIIQTSQPVDLATLSNDSIWAFSKPGLLLNLEDNQTKGSFDLEEPYSDFSFNSLATYQSSLYFLDNKNDRIVKYPYQGNFQWKAPELWLSSAIKKAIDGKSMAVDGSIWVLSKDNSIKRYYAGILQETLETSLFPEAESFTKILTSPFLSYLYLLEPVQNRIIVLNKSGQVIKQFHSEKFDNLLDFTVSEDGKTIWLLNGLKVYKLLL
jgi:hypothetical protein